jgi:hypothetical protein
MEEPRRQRDEVMSKKMGKRGRRGNQKCFYSTRYTHTRNKTSGMSILNTEK